MDTIQQYSGLTKKRCHSLTPSFELNDFLFFHFNNKQFLSLFFGIYMCCVRFNDEDDDDDGCAVNKL